MDKFSFLNAAHTTLFESLYEQYRTSPDRVEPSWKAFFQGFDFGAESVLEDWDLGELSNGKLNHSNNGVSVSVPESVQKEFQVVKLIDGYRSRGHLFTKTNPVRERRKYRPNLALSNFGLSESDLDTILMLERFSVLVLLHCELLSIISNEFIAIRSVLNTCIFELLSALNGFKII